MQTIQSIVGIFGLLAITFAISEDRRAVSIRQAAVGLGLTVVLAALFLKIPQLKVVFAAIGDAVNAIAAARRAGTSFVFGYLGGGPLPFELKIPGNEFVLALQVLPIVLVMSVLTTLGFCWGILRSNARLRLAVRLGCRPLPTFSSAWSRRRCSSDRILPVSPAVNCSW